MPQEPNANGCQWPLRLRMAVLFKQTNLRIIFIAFRESQTIINFNKCLHVVLDIETQIQYSIIPMVIVFIV